MDGIRNTAHVSAQIKGNELQNRKWTYGTVSAMFQVVYTSFGIHFCQLLAPVKVRLWIEMKVVRFTCFSLL